MTYRTTRNREAMRLAKQQRRVKRLRAKDARRLARINKRATV